MDDHTAFQHGVRPDDRVVLDVAPAADERIVIDDASAVLLARDISKKIEDEMEYPGQIKVVIIRETRAVDYAK